MAEGAGELAPEMLVLIDGNDPEAIAARRMIVTWPRIAEWVERHPDAVPDPNPDSSVHGFDPMHVEWSDAAGVDVQTIENVAPRLFRNGFIGPQGFVDAIAIGFIRRLIAAKLPKTSTRKEPSP